MCHPVQESAAASLTTRAPLKALVPRMLELLWHTMADAMNVVNLGLERANWVFQIWSVV